MADYAVLAEIVKALIIAKHFLETDLEKLRAAVSQGYARGMLPRDRKEPRRKRQRAAKPRTQ